MSVNTTTEQRITFSEGGINWCWYTELTLHENKTVTIHRHYRVYGFNISDNNKNHPKNTIKHPNYYGEQIWGENADRIAEKYFVPNVGWCEIDNPQHIFDYQ